MNPICQLYKFFGRLAHGECWGSFANDCPYRNPIVPKYKIRCKQCHEYGLGVLDDIKDSVTKLGNLAKGGQREDP